MNGLLEVLGKPPAPTRLSTASTVNGPTVSVSAHAALAPNTPTSQDTSSRCRTALFTVQAVQFAATPSMASRRTTMRVNSRDVSSTVSLLRRVTRPDTAWPLR